MGGIDIYRTIQGNVPITGFYSKTSGSGYGQRSAFHLYILTGIDAIFSAGLDSTPVFDDHASFNGINRAASQTCDCNVSAQGDISPHTGGIRYGSHINCPALQRQRPVCGNAKVATTSGFSCQIAID